ncbi:low molecular weight protein-tyrosine-phosphatase [Prochlorococcus sp. MIT 1341]|uniref:low molecular weight protein-tyrosine-phosphatase n=1 Tax=Prochlorococcus sp. MIT 1341 TaxID=3096221 RepID=UPI002A75BC7B|nr:low molecular weight protein-tyrosine-phosphatase [Prochlorococcus sp. MIT 1341]
MATKILFVCLGNICRSPAAEGVFLHLLKLKKLSREFEVDSAGTGGWHVGSLPDRRMQKAANNRGIELPSLARKINKNDLINFDLILTMDNENLCSVKALASELDCPPKAKIIPILSFGSNPNLTEVPDPYYGGDMGFERVLDLLEDACDGLLKNYSSNC